MPTLLQIIRNRRYRLLLDPAANGGGTAPENPAFSNVMFLDSYDGIDQATTARVEESNTGASGTFSGNAKLDDGVTSGMGYTTALFNDVAGTGGVRYNDSNSWSLGSDEFCFEAFVTPTATPGAFGGTIMSHYEPTTGQRAWAFQIYPDGGGIKTRFFWSNNGSTNDTPVLFDNSVDIELNTEYHVVVFREGNTLYSLVNGVLSSTTRDMTGETMHNSTKPMYVGALGNDTTLQNMFEGYISELRLTVGESVYFNAEAPYSVPTIPFARS